MAGNSIYRPLRDDGHEIRVLRLEPSSDPSDDSLKCRLGYILLHDNSAPASESTYAEREPKRDSENHSYTSDGENEETRETGPKAQQMHYATQWYKQRKREFSGDIPCGITQSYIALSYTWGDARDVVPIQVDGTTIVVTRNLRDALIAIRSEPQISSFPVWADAVCINQNDVKEQNNEVKRMFEVYRKASRVVIWLGYVPATWNFFDMKATGDVNEIIHRLLMKRSADSGVVHPVEITNDEFLTMAAILDRPYWTRIWILQELVMADYENIFFFWARTFRHISDLLHAHESFGDAANIWIRSAEVSSFLDSPSAPEDTGTPYDDENARNPDLEGDKTRIPWKLYLSRLGKAKFQSDIPERFIEGLRTGKRFDLQAYWQERCKGEDGLSSVETDKILESLEELSQIIDSDDNKLNRRLKRAEMKLALNELSVTMTTMVLAATVDATTDGVDFRLLITHALKGKCTNKSDVVYGLLGLHKHEIASQITPDYDLSIERVILDFSEAVIRCRGLNFLCEYETVLSGFRGSLPSWAVNLMGGAGISGSGEWARKWKNFSAGGVRTSDIRFLIDNDQLHCQGLLYKVDTKTPQPNYHDKALMVQALKRVVSCYTPGEEECRSILNISTQTTSGDSEVTNVIELIQAFWVLHSDFTIEGVRLKCLFPEQKDIMEWELETATKAINAVRFMNIFTIADGKLELGTKALRDGDSIAIPWGCNLPIILREHRGG